MPGTVRGRFELDAPALRELKELERQGIKTEAQMKALGAEMDRVGGADDTQRIRRYKESLNQAGAASSRFHKEMRKDWVESTRIVNTEINRQEKAIDRLTAKLDLLSSKTVTPRIDLDGFAEALAQVELLDSKIRALGRQNATANVGVRSSGGGGISRPAALGRAYGGGGAAGGGRRGGGLLDFGMSGIRPRNLLIGGALAYSRSLVGGAGALIGSAASGIGGAGALGAAGLGAGLIGGGLGVAVGKTMAKPIQDTQKAELALTQQIALHGRHSTQAAAAQDKLNLALKNAPKGTQSFLREVTQFRKEWMDATKGAQTNLLGAGTGFLGGLRGGLRGRGGIGASAGVATGAIKGAATDFGGFLGGQTGRQGIALGANMFAENLPKIEKDLEHVATIWFNIMKATRPFLREFNGDLEKTLARWEKGSEDAGKMRHNVGVMVDDLKAWGRLAKSTGVLMKDLFVAGRGPGTSMVEDLTRQMNEWDAAVKRNPASTRQFFADGVKSVKDLASALAGIVKALDRILKAVGPVLDSFAQLASLAGSTGLLGHAGILGAGYAGYKAFKGGGALLGGGAAAGAVGGAAGFRSAGRAAGVAGSPVGARPGTQRFGSDFRYAAPVSQLGQQASRFGRVGAFGGRLGGAAVGAGRAYLPVGALFAALEAGSFDGAPGQQLQAGLSSFTLGAVPMPTSNPQAKDRGTRIASDFLGTANTRSRGALNTQTRGLSSRIIAAERARATTGVNTPGTRTGIGLLDQLQVAAGGGGPKQYTFQGKQFDERELNAYIGTLRKELAVRRQIRGEMHNQAHDALVLQRQHHADNTFDDLAKSYDILRKKFGQKDALASFNQNLVKDMKKAGPAGRTQLAKNGAQWIAEMRRNGGLTADQADAANRRIVQSFRDMGERVRIINGEIMTGSRKEWAGIRDAIGGAAEQAREKANAEFTRIQKMAITSLNAMGFSPAEAKRLVQGMDPDTKSSTQRRQARLVTKYGPDYQATNQGVKTNTAGSPARGKATGGRLYGQGMHDNVQLASGDIGAPGELVVNRHTERRINRRLMESGTTLGREVQKEQRQHSAQPWEERRAVVSASPFGARRATGGRGPEGTGRTNVGGSLRSSASLAGVHAGVLDAGRQIERRFPGLTITSGTGGGHVSGSYHYKGEALDISGSEQEMFRASAWINRSGFYRQLTEGIHNPNLSVKNGRKVPSSVYSAVWAGHRNHIHIARADDSAIKGAYAMGSLGGIGASAPQQIHLRSRASGLTGVPGALADRAGAIYAHGLQTKINSKLGGGAAGSIAGGGGKGNVRGWLARALRITGHYSADNLNALYGRAMAESGGNPNAVNNWDSNAAKGQNSRGLLQTIPATFNAYRDPRVRGGITDPVANAVAAIRYMYARYHRIVGANGHGYATGGRLSGTAVVGDSLEVGTLPFLRKALGGGIHGNAKVGRSSASGVEALKGMSGYNRVLFDLGTNDGSAGALGKSIRAAQRVSGGAEMYVPLLHGPGASAKNAMLRRMQGGNLHLLDPGLRGLGPDGIHFTGKGYAARAQRLGQGIQHAGAFARGGSFVTRGPTTFLAGEGKSDEHIQVTPLRPRRRPTHQGTGTGGGKIGGGLTLQVIFQGPVHAASTADVEQLAETISQAAAKKLLHYIDHGVADDKELIGG